MKAYELDKDGYYISDIPFFDATTAPKYYTLVVMSGSFFKPKFDGTKWVEGDTRENHIGQTVYRIADKAPLLITTLGPIPEGYTAQVPREFDTWDGSLWITDLVLRNKVLKQRKMTEINNALEQALSALRTEYPESEIMSWTKQEDEARRFLKYGAAAVATPLIDHIVEARGCDKLELINKIVLKADQYAYAVGMAVGRRQYLEDQVMAIAIGDESKLDQYHF